MKEIKVDCPCCEAKLVVDVRTATVVRHATPDKLDEFGKPLQDQGRWDAAVDKVSRSKGSEDAFDSALRREQSRSRDLDDLFDRARSKVDRRERELEDEDDRGPAGPRQRGGR